VSGSQGNRTHLPGRKKGGHQDKGWYPQRDLSENRRAQIERIAKFYIPLLEDNYEDPLPRAADIEHLGQIASRYDTRQQFLTEIVLDPPASTDDLAGPPVKDEDWMVLSTIHSAKGLEWDAVYLIHAADGNLPADMATGTESEIAEELRLTYVCHDPCAGFPLHPLAVAVLLQVFRDVRQPQLCAVFSIFYQRRCELHGLSYSIQGI
jgi:UvrD-like helicase C-terminal domain